PYATLFRAAVGGQDGQHRTLYARDHGVAFGTLSAPAAFGHAGDGGVDLIAAAQVIGGAAHPFGHAAAVLGDARRVVLGPHPGVQPGVDPLGHAALAGEEAVAHPGLVE